jgi:hypothetical protein
MSFIYDDKRWDSLIKLPNVYSKENAWRTSLLIKDNIIISKINWCIGYVNRKEVRSINNGTKWI